MKKKAFLSAKARREKERAKTKRAALKALLRARKRAEQNDVALTPWEGEFLGSVEARIEIYGRAFADPEKGPPGHALSLRQTIKLKEIAGKANGKTTLHKCNKGRRSSN